MTMRGNGFEDGAGVCLTASRTDKGNDYLKGPQMFAISIFGHLNFGEVVNELAQIQGEQRKGMPSKLSLVNGVMFLLYFHCSFIALSGDQLNPNA